MFLYSRCFIAKISLFMLFLIVKNCFAVYNSKLKVLLLSEYLTAAARLPQCI